MVKIFILLFLICFSCKETELIEIEEIKRYAKLELEIDTAYDYNFDDSLSYISVGGEEIKNGHIVKNGHKLGQSEFKIKPKSEEIIVEEILIIPEEDDNYGDISYLIKDTMIVGETHIINLTISKNVHIIKIIEEVETFTTPENIKTDKIRIERKMQAKLIDPIKDNFIISSITSEVQIIEDKEITLWEWNVTPLKKGSHKLILSIDILLDGDVGKTIKVYDGFIYVYSDLSIMDKIGIFFKEQWKWFFSTLIIPLLIFFYKKRKKKK